jgi:hypothetical protein
MFAAMFARNLLECFHADLSHTSLQIEGQMLA